MAVDWNINLWYLRNHPASLFSVLKRKTTFGQPELHFYHPFWPVFSKYGLFKKHSVGCLRSLLIWWKSRRQRSWLRWCIIRTKWSVKIYQNMATNEDIQMVWWLIWSSVTGEKEEGFEEVGLGSTAAKYQGSKKTLQQQQHNQTVSTYMVLSFKLTFHDQRLDLGQILSLKVEWILNVFELEFFVSIAKTNGLVEWFPCFVKMYFMSY